MITRCHCHLLYTQLWLARALRYGKSGRRGNNAKPKLPKNMKNDAPMFGKYVKLIKTGEILKWKSYDPKSQMLEIELPTGAVSAVHRNKIDRITTNEEIEFLRSRVKNSNLGISAA